MLALASSPSRLLLTTSALCVLIIGCGPPETGNGDHMPWGGIELDDEDPEDGGEDGESDGDAGGSDDAGADDDTSDSGDPGDDGPSSDDDGTGDDGDPVEPPGSPYTGGWDIGTCQDQVSPTGTGVGQVVPDFLLYDQFGDQVRLYDFCHEAVYIVAGAFW